MKLVHVLFAAFVALLLFSAVVVAQDDDEQPEGSAKAGRPIEDVTEGVDAEDAADEIDNTDPEDDSSASSGLRAVTHFLNYADLKVPAGERLQMLVPIVSAPSNPSYEVFIVAAHLATLDHSRFIQNFSAQAYDRKAVAGQTATLKYTATPDALIDPNEYAFVVVAYLRNEDNQTLQVTAFNGTMTVVDPLGFDFKGTFTLLAFFGGIGYAAYYYFTQKQTATKAEKPERRPRSDSPSSPAGKKGASASSSAALDEEFVDKEHLAFLKKASARKRSASPQ